MGVHVFDAKFKVSWGSKKTADLEADEGEEERSGSFVRGDVYKMHTYRDALAGVHSAWVLYPGEEFRFFPTEHAESPGTFGVGVIPLQPTLAATDLISSLERILTPASP